MGWEDREGFTECSKEEATASVAHGSISEDL